MTDTRRDLALRVAARARDADDCRDLLDALGLLAALTPPASRRQPARPRAAARPRLAQYDHGDYRRYQHGCRCDRCRAANTAAARAWRERAAAWAAQHPPDDIDHGTPRGGSQHWYRGIPLCGPCRDAYNRYRAERRRRRTQAVTAA